MYVCVCVRARGLVPRRQQPAEPDSLPTGPAEEEAVLWALLPGHQLRALPSWVGGGNKHHTPSSITCVSHRSITAIFE